jgi:cytochrome P450
VQFATERVDVPYVAGLQQLTDYAEINEVLRSRSFVQGAFDMSAPHFLANSLLILDGPAHLERRRMEAHLFSKSALAASKADHLEPMVDAAIADLQLEAGTGIVRVDLVPLLRQMLCRMVAKIAGLDEVELGEPANRLAGYVDKLGAGMTVEWATADQDRIIAEGLAARAEFERDLFRQPAARRRALVEDFRAGKIAREELPKDLITLLYLHWHEDWDAELPLRETTALLVGSMQTTAQATQLFVLNLFSWFADHPEDRARAGEDSAFLRRALYESLRLFVASPVRIRRATEDVVLASGRRIAKGERVGLLYRAANVDRSLFGDDAPSFNPHREVEGTSPWGLAFGGGMHACLGRPLVTGIASGEDVTDGTMPIIVRRLLAAGMELDPTNPPVPDDSTFYDAYSSLPVVLGGL